jgi:hypothetical protein
MARAACSAAWCSPRATGRIGTSRRRRLHGIGRTLLSSHGRPAAWVAEQLNLRLQGQTVYCDGWAQDYPWLARLFDAAERSPAFRLEDLRKLLSEEQALHWHELVTQVRDELSIGRHRASSDAKVLQIALARMQARIQSA